MDTDQFRLYVVRPTLEYLEPEIPYTKAAEDLIVGTARQESRLKYIRQLGKGPARGFLQMEPNTEQDIWEHYLSYRSDLSNKVQSLVSSRYPLGDDLTTNLAYQVAMTRVHYWRSPKALPKEGDIKGYAKLWKAVYNTFKGKGKESEFIDNYEV